MALGLLVSARFGFLSWPCHGLGLLDVRRVVQAAFAFVDRNMSGPNRWNGFLCLHVSPFKWARAVRPSRLSGVARSYPGTRQP